MTLTVSNDVSSSEAENTYSITTGSRQDRLYFINAMEAEIQFYNLRDGNVQTVAELPTSNNESEVSENLVYDAWADILYYPNSTTGDLHQLSLTDGVVSTTATGLSTLGQVTHNQPDQVMYLTVPGSRQIHVYDLTQSVVVSTFSYEDSLSAPTAITYQDQALYTYHPGTYEVRSASVDFAGSTQRAQFKFSPTTFASDPTAGLIYGEFIDAGVAFLDLTNGAVTQISDKGVDITGITVNSDGSKVYWITTTGALYMCNADGTGQQQLLQASDGAQMGGLVFVEGY